MLATSDREARTGAHGVPTLRSRLRGGVATHRVFLGLIVAGALLRILTVVAYRPAMEFVQDSFDYLGDAHRLAPGVIRPLGYPLFLRAVSLTGHFGTVAAVQHLLGLAMAVMLYAVLQRRGARPWLAALAVAPLLLDAYQVYMEQFVLAETLFEFLVVAALVLLLWDRRAGGAVCTIAGGLLAMSALTRTVGVILLVPAFAYLVVTRVGFTRVACFGGAAAVILGAYAGWYDSANGKPGLQGFEGYFLAGRVEPFADCRASTMPAPEAQLCDDRPVAERPGPDWYVWNPASPLRRTDMAPGADRNAVAGSFATRVIRHQTGDYLATVAHDLAHYLSPVRATGDRDGPVQTFQFRTSFTPDPWQPAYPPSDPYVWQWTWPGASVRYGNIVATHGFGLVQARPRLDTGIATNLRAYQRVGYTPGPLLAAAVLVGLAAGIGRLSRTQRQVWWAVLLLGATGLLLLVVPSATASFDFRYLLPALTVLPAVGVLGVELLFGRLLTTRHPPSPGATSRPVT